MFFRQIFDPHLAQYAYLIGCQQTGEALIIDPERDVDRYLARAADEGLRIVAVAETHIHADFLSGARELAEQLPWLTIYVSAEGGPDWQYEWVDDERYRAVRLRDGDSFTIGKIEVRAAHTPGHTPEHLSFLVTDHGGGAEEPMGMASGDFVFVGDLGRPDLLESAAGQAGAMEPSARTLYRSVGRFQDLADHLQIWPAHGAGSACGKSLGAVPISTVGYEKRHNAAIAAAARGEDAFVDAILEGQPEPPLYFGRMKRLNKEGPPVLGTLPKPERLEVADLVARVAGDGAVVIDARRDRRVFMAGHLEGSLYAPFDKTFPTIAGSYVRPEETIYPIVEERALEALIRDLVRIGLDRVGGYATPEALASWAEEGGAVRATEVGTFETVRERLDYADTVVLDVRRAAEYEAGHVPGAINVAHTRLLERIGEVPAEKTVMVHCLSGARAAAASALLERAGRDVVYIDDAIGRWRELAA